MTEAKKPGRKLVPADPNLDDGEKAAIKAVRAYEAATKTIDLFKLENEELLTTYSELLEEQEAKRQVADAAIRQTDASFGPWQRFSEQKKYFPELIYQHLGEEKFLALGGTIGKKPVYEMDKKVIDVAIAAKKIPAAIVPEIRKISSRYRAPKAPGET